MLVHHADTGLDGVTRRTKVNNLAVHCDGSRVGPMQPVEGFHQGGLAGAVLADNGVNRATLNTHRDIAVGDYTREALTDVAQFHRRRICSLLRHR